MPHVELPSIDEILHRFSQMQQTQQIADRTARAPQRCRSPLVRHAEFVDQPLDAVRLFQRIELLALDVLDQGNRQRRLVRHGTHHRRNLGQPGLAGRPPAPFPGDQFVFTQTDLAHHDRLDYPLRQDRVRQLGQRRLVHVGTRLIAPRADIADFQRRQPVFGMVGRQQDIQPAPQPFGFLFGHTHAVTAIASSRASNSSARAR